ncbi:unnamed protein product [Penicillium olsonii]|nr:unnamed protein product [Penicillium olsonii]
MSVAILLGCSCSELTLLLQVGWVGTAVLMAKCQLGLGVLSLPAAFDTLGMVPGVLCMLSVAFVVTWGSYVIGGFKLNHREIYGIDDATGVMFGFWGRELIAICFILFLIFCAGSGLLSISIGLNAVSSHGACTAIFVAVACVAVMLLGSIRTLSRLRILAWIGLVSILSSILIVTIAVGVEEKPASAPPGKWTSDYKIIGNPTFVEGVTAVSTFIFAYAGTPFYFPIVAEMRDPRDYPKSLVLCQSLVTVTYLVIGIVMYYYSGSYIASPALGSAGKLLKQISYGIALPGLIVSSTMSTHLASKHIFLRILRGSRHVTADTMTHWVTWLGSVFTVSIVAYCIASGIPVFDNLVSLIGAFLGTLMCFQPLGCMWLYDNWAKGKTQRTARWVLMVCWSAFVVLVGMFLMVAGTYGAVIGIIDSYHAEGGSSAWSCADNSNSS